MGRKCRKKKTICATERSISLYASSARLQHFRNGRSTGSWKTNAAFRHVSWSKLSRGVWWTQQSGVCREMWRFFTRARRNRLLATIAQRRENCLAGKAIGSPAGMRRAHRYFCDNPEALKAVVTLFCLRLLPWRAHPPSRTRTEMRPSTNKIGTSFGRTWKTL